MNAIDYIRMAHARRLAAYVTAKRDLCDSGQLIGEMSGIEVAASFLDYSLADDLIAARLSAINAAIDMLLASAKPYEAEADHADH